MRHGTNKDLWTCVLCVSCLVYICAMTHCIYVPWLIAYMCHDSLHICAMTQWHICHDTDRSSNCSQHSESWRFHTCAVPDLYMCHDSSHIYAMTQIYICVMTHTAAVTTAHIARHDSSTNMLWLIYICAITHLHMCRHLFVHVPWLIHMSRWCEFHDSFMDVPWLIHMSSMTHLCMCHDSFI